MKRFHGTAWFTAILVICGVFLITGRGIAADTVKLGVAGAHSGDLASYGLPSVKAAELVVKDINAKGGVLGKEVVLLVEDDVCKPEVATNTATKLLSQGVHVVMGHICSGATKAALAIYKAENIICMSPSATNPPLTQSGEYPTFYRTIASDDAQARLEVDYAINVLKAKKIAVLHDKGDYGKGLAEFAKAFIEKDSRAEVVLYDGEVIEIGGKSLDNPGFDLPGLLVGSEGTLGMVTKLVLRMMPKTEAVKTMLAIYDTIADGANTVSDIVKAGMIPTTLEMMDNLTIKAVEAAYHVGFPEDAASILLIELDGLQDGMDRLTDQVVAICKQNKVREVRVAKNEAEREKIWAGRKGAFGAVGRLRPNYLVNDPTVPRTRLPEALAQVVEIGKKYNLPIANVFHAGDGNLHPLILFDERDKDELDRVHKAAFEIMEICALMGGTISGEHGIGVEKLKGMALIFSDQDVAAMWNVKKAFDPDGVYNPGKLLPAQKAA